MTIKATTAEPKHTSTIDDYGSLSYHTPVEDDFPLLSRKSRNHCCGDSCAMICRRVALLVALLAVISSVCAFLVLGPLSSVVMSPDPSSLPSSSTTIQTSDTAVPLIPSSVPEQVQPTQPPKVIASLDLARQGPLMDLIHVIDKDSAELILSEISSVEHDVPGCEVQVVMVNNIAYGWSSPKQFATSLFNEWGLGSRETNNGVLILFLLDARRIEVEVGASLDAYMNQDWTESMLNGWAVPEFKKGNYGVGINNVVMHVADRLREVENGTATASPSQGILSIILFTLIGLVLSCAFGSCWCDSKYPMGRHRICQRCGHSDWRHQSWNEIRAATYRVKGLKRRFCICNKCQSVEYIDVTIPSKSDSGGGGGGGGYSDGGGGGGASW